jgi:mono/diheme cytochrome c family protein
MRLPSVAACAVGLLASWTFVDAPPVSGVDAGAERSTTDRPTRAAAFEPQDPTRLPGYPTYAKHCASCHGETGDGRGVGARFLDPPPRDFTFGAFRFVSTQNHAPSGKDVFETIGAGLAGTAMLPFAHLGEETVWSLVDVVLAFREQGIRKSLARSIDDPAALDQAVARRTKPILADDPAPETPETAASAARGLVHYRAHCAKCHGVDGRGLDAAPMKTEEGHPNPPGDLTEGVFKQSPLKKNWFSRIRLGIPGTAMPAHPPEALDDAAVWDLIHYVKTLSAPAAQTLYDAAQKDIRARTLTGEPPTRYDDPRFEAAPETWVPLVPFRRAEWTTRGLLVRALIDDETAWFRATYADPTENRQGLSPPAPPDGLAIRLTAAAQPPTLPIPGQIPPIDRALSLRGPMPPPTDPRFDALPRFENPERVCKMVAPPERVGEAVYVGGAWRVVIGVRRVESAASLGGRLSASFAVFDGALRRGPMPTAFSHWCEIAIK